ncbi:putative nucleoporin [Helianthus debilis subsp. tardiflorus]
MLSMKQTDKKRSPTINQTKRPAKVESRETKLQQEKSNKTLRSKEQNKKAPSARSNNNIVVTDRKKNIKPYENHEKFGVNYTDKVSRFRHDKPITDFDKESNNGREESDSETITDSISSSGDSPATERDFPSQVNTPTSISNESKGFKVHAKPPSTPSSISSEGFDGPDLEEPKEVGIVDEVDSDGSNEEMLDAMENIEQEAKEDLDPRIAKMEMRIEQLEDELREVAALEISLYSVVQEHGNSAHKVHKPAQYLSRLYIRTGKYFSQQKRATIGRNIVSGLVMISMSCGNDVSRLTFWWSNIVVLREILTQAFASKQSNNPDVNEFVDDGPESRTFISELEKVESEIFSRIVESIWVQTLMPKMLTDVTLGDQQQVNFLINLWQNAFYDAFKRLCPVRAKGHECGCLHALARMVMEQCVARLDVAMFNAVIRESSDESPADSVSNPVTETRVLPIPVGDLSFGSGAQLKKAVGNWSRWLTDRFSVDTDAANEVKWFGLLDSLSNLLMVPKDLIVDRNIRTELCPSISLPLLKQILCGFTPDEFCPDPVPQTVIEAVNAECITEGISSDDNANGFAHRAATIIYKPPLSIDFAKRVYEEVKDQDSSPMFIIGNLNGSIASYVGANARYKLLHEVWSS